MKSKKTKEAVKAFHERWVEKISLENLLMAHLRMLSQVTYPDGNYTEKVQLPPEIRKNHALDVF